MTLAVPAVRSPDLVLSETVPIPFQQSHCSQKILSPSVRTCQLGTFRLGFSYAQASVTSSSPFSEVFAYGIFCLCHHIWFTSLSSTNNELSEPSDNISIPSDLPSLPRKILVQCLDFSESSSQDVGWIPEFTATLGNSQECLFLLKQRSLNGAQASLLWDRELQWEFTVVMEAWPEAVWTWI